MKSHLIAIINRLNGLVEKNDPKETFNFERDGEVIATISYLPEETAFAIKYPKQKDTAVFDDIDLVALDLYDELY